MFAAVLDTSVLWPSTQRDFLLSMAVEGLYRPLWSELILEELRRTESIKRQRRGESAEEADGRAVRLIEQMRIHFEDALVDGCELIRPAGLPDPNDEHVLAAAVASSAGAVVTENVRDFPSELVPSRIRVLSAHRFITNTVGKDPEGARRALQAMAERRGSAVAEVMIVLQERYKLEKAVETLRSA